LQPLVFTITENKYPLKQRWTLRHSYPYAEHSSPSFYFRPLQALSKYWSEMFLKQQTWFYRMYFSLTDFLNLLTITWDCKRNILVSKKRRYWNTLLDLHLVTSLLYMIRAIQLFVTLIISSSGSSSFLQKCAFHIVGLSCGLYLLLYRIMYAHKTSELICLVNTAFAFEQDYLYGKLLRLLWCKNYKKVYLNTD